MNNVRKLQDLHDQAGYKKDAINAALNEYVNRHKQIQIKNVFNSISYDSDYDYKKGRKKR